MNDKKDNITIEKMPTLSAGMILGAINETLDNLTFKELQLHLLALNIAQDLAEYFETDGRDTLPQYIDAEELKEKQPLKLAPISLLTDKAGKYYISVYDTPATDPSAPLDAFNPSLYKNSLIELKPTIEDLLTSLTDYQAQIVRRLCEVAPVQPTETTAENENKVILSPDNINNIILDFDNWLSDLMPNISADLLPYIKEALKNPNFSDIMQQLEAGKVSIVELEKGEQWEKLKKEALKIKKKANNWAGKVPPKKDHIITDEGLKIPFLDIANNAIKSREDIDGQLKIAFSSRNAGTTNINYLYIEYLKNYPGLEELNDYDFLVYIAIYSYMEQYKLNIMPLQALYSFMGYTGNIGQKERVKIHKSLEKLNGTKIYFDFNETIKTLKKHKKNISGYDFEEHQISGQRGKRLLYYDPLINIIYDGVLIGDAIEIQESPILFNLAEKRGHINTIPIECLQFPRLARNADNLAIVFYCLERIYYARQDKKEKDNNIITIKILYASLYEKCKIKDIKKELLLNKEELTKAQTLRRSKARDIRKNLFIYLEYLKKINYIIGFDEFPKDKQQKEYFEIYLNNSKLLEEKKA